MSEHANIPGSKEPFSLSDSVSPNSTQTVEAEVVGDGTLESFSVRIYPGPELQLKITPFIHRDSGNGPRLPLVTAEGKEVIDGDDDKWTWSPSKAVNEGDLIIVEAENTDGTNSYDYRVNFDVDYRGGINDWIGGFF